MARRNNKQRRRPRVRRGPRGSGLLIPMFGSIDEGKSLNIALNDLLYAAGQTFFADVPWRLMYVRYEFTLIDNNNINPAYVQIGVNSAGLQNVENVRSRRILVQKLPRPGVLRPRAPNLWKENEQRKQAIITISNFSFNTSTEKLSRIFFALSVSIQFGPIPYSKPASLHAWHDDDIDFPEGESPASNAVMRSP